MTDREIDALVAEHLFGAKPGVTFFEFPAHDMKPREEPCNEYRDEGYGEGSYCMGDALECSRCGAKRCLSDGDHSEDVEVARPERRTCARDPYPYTRDVAAAWPVVEAMRAKSDGHFALLAFTTNWRAGWSTPSSRDDVMVLVEAPTAAKAICLAALRALGVEIPA